MASKKKESTKAKEPAEAAPLSAGANTAEDFEKLGVFYLGRPYDLVTKQPRPGWLLYDSKDLVTHAVCVGMTGSGKTGSVPLAARRSGDRRHSRHHHRSQGRPRKSDADVSESEGRRFSALD